MLTVHQHWDPIKVAAVGRCYPPEFFNYIKNHKTRDVFHRIAEETEEDFQKLISVLEKFDVKIIYIIKYFGGKKAPIKLNPITNI